MLLLRKLNRQRSSSTTIYLRVKGKLVEFEVFEEASFDAPSLVDGCLATRIEHQRLPHRLLRLSEVVLHVQLRVPELLPLDVLDVLQWLELDKHINN